MIRRLLMLLAVSCWALWTPVIALAQLDPQNMPSPTRPLTGAEIIPCDQTGGYKKCLFSDFTPSGNANLIYATPNGASGSASLRSMVIPDMPITGVTPGSYLCTNLTVDAEGLLTVAANGSCGLGSITIPGYSCTNTGGIITCTQPCDAWPIVVCSRIPPDGLPAVPITLAAKPAIGDVLVAFTNLSGATFAAGWTPVAACNPGGNIPGEAYHIVGPGDGQLYSPSTNISGANMVQGIVDVTALGAAGGSWANAFNSAACGTHTHPPTTVSGTTPATGAIQIAIGAENASTGAQIAGMSLTGIATDPQYGSAVNSSVPAAMGIAYAVGAGSGSAYSATWTSSGAGVLDDNYLAVLFFNAGPTFATPACAPSSGSCAMTSQSGPAAMYMTLSGASAATTLALTQFPAVTNAYACQPLMDKTTTTIWGLQTGWSTTGATFTFYTKGTATAASPGAADVVTTSCWGT